MAQQEQIPTTNDGARVRRTLLIEGLWNFLEQLIFKLCPFRQLQISLQEHYSSSRPVKSATSSRIAFENPEFSFSTLLHNSIAKSMTSPSLESKFRPEVSPKFQQHTGHIDLTSAQNTPARAVPLLSSRRASTSLPATRSTRADLRAFGRFPG